MEFSWSTDPRFFGAKNARGHASEAAPSPASAEVGDGVTTSERRDTSGDGSSDAPSSARCTRFLAKPSAGACANRAPEAHAATLAAPTHATSIAASVADARGDRAVRARHHDAVSSDPPPRPVEPAGSPARPASARVKGVSSPASVIARAPTSNPARPPRGRSCRLL